jgi:hypothetical protein
LEFADGGVKRHGEGALTADQIRPLEFYPEAMPLLSDFERIRGEDDHVVAPIDLQYTFQGFIERRHYQYSSACRATDPMRASARVRYNEAALGAVLRGTQGPDGDADGSRKQGGKLLSRIAINIGFRPSVEAGVGGLRPFGRGGRFFWEFLGQIS